jgi:hypothetical protein
MTKTADRVPLGPLSVSRQRFGCMGLSHTYGQADEAESLATLDRAVELGINFFDTADVYGLGRGDDRRHAAADGPGALQHAGPPQARGAPFGTIKAWMGSTHFLMKRLKNV